MRRVLFLFVPLLVTSSAFAGTSVRMHGRPLFQTPHIDLSAGATFAMRQPDAGDADILFHRPVPPTPNVERSILPSLRVGPFHATVGGGQLGRIHLGPDHLETQDFWNSTFTGGAGSRGAKVTFTLPTH